MLEQTSELTRHDDVLIPVGEETVAAVRLEPTARKEPLPVLLVYTPYRVHDRAYGLHAPIAEFFAERGYHVVLADMVGTGASTGVRSEPLTPAEGEEAATIVEWLADREWSTGRVGMFGLSYPGITALAAATEDPDGLEAIVPIHAPYTGFRDLYAGSAFSLYFQGGHAAPMHHALRALPPSRRDPGGRWARVWEERLEGLRSNQPWLFQYLEHDTDDAYWREKDVLAERITTPTFAVAGYRDAYSPTTLEYLDRIDAPTYLLIGPWGHVLPPEAEVAPVDFYRQARAWFDCHLKGDSTGTAVGEGITYWTENAGGAGTESTGRGPVGAWRSTDRWPMLAPSGAPVGTGALELAPTSFALTPVGLVESDEYAEGRLDRDYPVDHTVGVESDGRFVGRPVDSSGDDARSLTFETAPLPRPLEVTGSGYARLRFRSTTSDPLLAVRLIDVVPDGTSRPITRGQIRATHAGSRRDPSPLATSDEHELAMGLKPCSHVLGEGHRLRVAISGGLFPLMLPPREHGTLTMLSTPKDPSVVAVPARSLDNDGKVSEQIPLDSPVPGYDEPERAGAWRVAREHLGGRAEVRSTSAYWLPFEHVVFDYEETIEADVGETGPGTAKVSNDLDVALKYDHETVRARVRTRASHDTAGIETRVAVDGQPVFEETWHWTR